jgi:PAS domain S-box-containing protein
MTPKKQGRVGAKADESRRLLARTQRDVNEQLVLSSLRAHEAADAAEASARELRAREAALRTLADTMPILAWYANPDGYVPWFNRRWYEYTGKTLEQQEGWKWESVHDPDDLPRVVAKWRAALASGEPWEDQFRLRGQDGQFRWFLSRAVPLRDDSGRVVRWFGTNVDIDDQKRAAEERLRLLASERKARNEAEAADRLKDEFLATISHELRTPLNAILGWSSLLRRGPRDDKSIDRALATIERNAKTQARLIDDILDVSRIITGKLRLDLRRVDMNAIARAAVDVVRPAADAKRVHVEVDLPPEEGVDRLVGDADRLQQVVWNLLSNAVKFTPPEGTVSLRVEQVGSTERVTVRDTGVGIAPEHLPFIFERFAQVDSSTTRRQTGLGLGLAIVRHLAEMHGGTVTAQSGGLGLGTAFTVTLPIGAVHQAQAETETETEAETMASTTASQPPSALAGVKVLVVDDEEDSRLLIQSALERVGACVSTAASAEAAVAFIESHAVDVMISDIGMPDEDGYRLMRRVRALPKSRGGEVPALALTAYARGEDVMRARQAGYQMHLPKPADVDELTRAVARLAPSGLH